MLYTVVFDLVLESMPDELLCLGDSDLMRGKQKWYDVEVSLKVGAMKGSNLAAHCGLKIWLF